MTRPPRPKVVLFVETNCDGTVGGSYFCLLEIVKGLDRQRYRPEVVFYQDNRLVPEFEKICPVHFVSIPKALDISSSYQGGGVTRRLACASLKFVQKCLNLLRCELYTFIVALRLITHCRAKIVHLNNGPSFTPWLLASKVMGCRCVAHLRGLWNPTWLHNRLLAYYDVIICISQTVSRSLLEARPSTNNSCLIYDGIDLEQTHAASLASLPELESISNAATFRVGVVGNIKRWKGQHVMLEALKHLSPSIPPVQAVIVGGIADFEGDRRYSQELKEYIEQYGLAPQVIELGFLPNALPLIRSLNVLLHTSIDPEPLGRSILEAMVIGVPVIASATGGPAEIIIDNESGLLVTPGNSQELAQAILKLMADRELGEQLAQRAKVRVRQIFSLAANLSAIQTRYDSLNLPAVE